MTNELSTGNHGNALTITEQFPEGKYNLLVPIKTVAEIAEISPICSIMVASAIGAITRIAVRLNLQSWKGGSPAKEDAATPEKSRIALPSALVNPAMFMIRAAP